MVSLATAQQPISKRSRIEPIDIFGSGQETSPNCSSRRHVLIAHKILMETSVSKLVIIFLACKNLMEEVHIRNWHLR